MKRRFTRQNRDLARTNSAQSQRIRNLETEISRLLADNISFREAAIAAQKEAERCRSTYYIEEAVREVRDKLQRKLDAVAGLMEELGSLPDRARRKERDERRRSGVIDLNPIRSPNEKDWRNRQTLAGVLGQEDGRLPAILEDKQYPRRTLDALQNANLLDEPAPEPESESPDVGPPPVASFDDVDVVPNNDGEEVQHQTNDMEAKDADMRHLPASLETRRKRRTSSLLQDLRKEQIQDEPKKEDQGALFKSGAKRKLEASDLEDPNPDAFVHPDRSDDFTFHRRPALKPAARTGSRFGRPVGQQAHGHIIIPNAGVSPQKTRQALAPKSTNSPSKQVPNQKGKPNVNVDDLVVSGRPSMQANRSQAASTRPRSRQSEMKVQSQVEGVSDAPGANSDLPPKTPANLDEMLSPISAEPSASNSGPARRGPQEAAIINSVEDVLNGSIGRASRRAKSAVSYAEPKLNSKMRRPGKELVGAIEGIGGKRDSASMDRERSRAPTEARSTTVKREVEEDKWKHLPMLSKVEPTSPLSDKKQEPHRIARTEHARRQPSVDSSQGLGKAIEKLNIFDPPLSSPTEAEFSRSSDNIAPSEPATRRKASTATSRRHSVMSASANANSSVLHTKTNRSVLDRPSSAASNRLDRGRDALDLKRSSSTATIKPGVEIDPVASRADRIASRRRSMMI